MAREEFGKWHDGELTGNSRTRMTAFEHVTALLSFVYALALTHLLARIAELIVARDRVKFSGLLTLGMVNAILLVFANWLSLWDLRSTMGPVGSRPLLSGNGAGIHHNVL